MLTALKTWRMIYFEIIFSLIWQLSLKITSNIYKKLNVKFWSRKTKIVF